MPKPQPKVRITFDAPKSLIDKIKRMAFEEGISLSDIIRKILRGAIL